MELFWEQGYEKTSMQDLVNYMGVHRRSIYDTFGDKHTLFMRALSHFVEVMEVRMKNEVKTDVTLSRLYENYLSLRTGSNKRFGKDRNFPLWKQKLFSLAGAKYDHKAKKHDLKYHFIFVRTAHKLKKITKIIEENNIVPEIYPTLFP